jgi:hypothetical protein
VFLDIYEEYKIQVSISHTPEGTNTARIILIALIEVTIVRNASIKVHVESVRIKGTTWATSPVESGGVTR